MHDSCPPRRRLETLDQSLPFVLYTDGAYAKDGERFSAFLQCIIPSEPWDPEVMSHAFCWLRGDKSEHLEAGGEGSLRHNASVLAAAYDNEGATHSDQWKSFRGGRGGCQSRIAATTRGAAAPAGNKGSWRRISSRAAGSKEARSASAIAVGSAGT